MAFVCTLHPDHPVTLTQLKSEAGQGETIVRIPIGVDDENETVFSVFVCLATVVGFGELRHELVFHVVAAHLDGEDFFSDGAETRYIISDSGDRRRVLEAIGLATEMLIDEVAPLEVIMTTHEPNLPPKALQKYGFIGSILIRQGYIPAHPDPYHGRHIWMFTQP
ncbi:UNVERIFIED_ORG: hypothetical protein GGI61_002254 [Rhizobium esperanzae]